MMRIFHLFLLISLLNVSSLFCGESATANLFRPNDKWLVVGDSITQNGTYYGWVYLYFATRFPETKFDAQNCGISGDSASGALKRYEWDIQPRKGTVATVMFGMNDVNRSLYNDPNETPDIKAKKEGALNAYRQNQTALAEKLSKDGVRLAFVTPSIFDETVDNDRPRQTGVNGALGECATFVKQLAEKYNAPVLDLHAPMTELNKKLQATNPKFTIIGPDRIHPADPGHFVMAYFFLKSLSAPATVSKVVLDASSSKTVETFNASVSDINLNAQELSFKVLEKALPYPIAPSVQPALEWVPFQKDFNQEILSIKNLPAQKYALSIDDIPIKEFSSSDLATGINLAMETNTPQYQQALKVLKLVTDWRGNEANRRVIAQVEHFHLKALPRPVTLETATPEVNKELERLNALPTPLAHMDNYNKGVLERYLKFKPQDSQLTEKSASLVDQIYQTAAPQTRSYKLSPR